MLGASSNPSQALTSGTMAASAADMSELKRRVAEVLTSSILKNQDLHRVLRTYFDDNANIKSFFCPHTGSFALKEFFLHSPQSRYISQIVPVQSYLDSLTESFSGFKSEVQQMMVDLGTAKSVSRPIAEEAQRLYVARSECRAKLKLASALVDRLKVPESIQQTLEKFQQQSSHYDKDHFRKLSEVFDAIHQLEEIHHTVRRLMELKQAVSGKPECAPGQGNAFRDVYEETAIQCVSAVEVLFTVCRSFLMYNTEVDWRDFRGKPDVSLMSLLRKAMDILGHNPYYASILSTDLLRSRRLSLEKKFKHCLNRCQRLHPETESKTSDFIVTFTHGGEENLAITVEHLLKWLCEAVEEEKEFSEHLYSSQKSSDDSEIQTSYSDSLIRFKSCYSTGLSLTAKHPQPSSDTAPAMSNLNAYLDELFKGVLSLLSVQMRHAFRMAENSVIQLCAAEQYICLYRSRLETLLKCPSSFRTPEHSQDLLDPNSAGCDQQESGSGRPQKIEAQSHLLACVDQLKDLSHTFYMNAWNQEIKHLEVSMSSLESLDFRRSTQATKILESLGDIVNLMTALHVDFSQTSTLSAAITPLLNSCWMASEASNEDHKCVYRLNCLDAIQKACSQPFLDSNENLKKIFESLADEHIERLIQIKTSQALALLDAPQNESPCSQPHSSSQTSWSPSQVNSVSLMFSLREFYNAMFTDTLIDFSVLNFLQSSEAYERVRSAVSKNIASAYARFYELMEHKHMPMYTPKQIEAYLSCKADSAVKEEPSQ